MSWIYLAAAVASVVYAGWSFSDAWLIRGCELAVLALCRFLVRGQTRGFLVALFGLGLTMPVIAQTASPIFYYGPEVDIWFGRGWDEMAILGALLGAPLVIAALFTSFYSWRLMFLTFYGKPRGDKHTHEHAHESPMVMLIPLGVLSLGAVFAGAIWYNSFFGHTDSVASDAYNLQLSRNRANAVAAVARAAGARISSVTGYGERKPTASNATPQGRALNRRVEIMCVG